MWILDNPYNPFLLVFIGTILALAAFFIWLQSGRKEALYAAATILGVFLILVIVERMMISDREAIEATLQQVARDLETNQRDAVYAVIHPSKPELLAQAKAELPGYTFTECRITKFQRMEIASQSTPKTAVVGFNVIVQGNFKHGADYFSGMTIARYVTLYLEQDTDGKWKVVDYTHEEPQAAIMEQEMPQ
jgi:hypothetical protein